MDIIKAFKLDEKEHPINIRGTKENPLFQANQVGELLDMRNIRATICKFDEKYKVIQKIQTNSGSQDVTFLTELGLYRLLGISKKPIAIVFQEWVVNAIKEIRTTGGYKMKEESDVDQALMKSAVELSVHNTLIDKMKKKRVVYLSRIRDMEDGRRIIKIGSSDDIHRRSTELIITYGESTVLQVFECNDNRSFELYLQHHPEIESHIYKESINGHTSREMFLLNHDEYENVIKIISRSIKKFNRFDNEQYLEKNRIRNERMKLMLDILKQKEILHKLSMSPIEKKRYELAEMELDEVRTELYEENDEEEAFETVLAPPESFGIDLSSIDVDHIVQQAEEEYESDSDNLSVDSFDETMYMKKSMRGRGPKIQKYDPETFELIKTYDTVLDVVRELDGSSPSAIRSATKINNVYRGYRWFSIDRSTEEKKYEIPATVKIHEQRKELLAELNLDKNKIINVYSSQKEAGIAMKLKSPASIANAIKRESLAAHRYWKFFDDCDEKMKQEYLKDHMLPEQEKPKGIGIEMVDPRTKQVIDTFFTMAEVIKKHPMGRTSLKNAIANNHMHNGYLWRYTKNE